MSFADKYFGANTWKDRAEHGKGAFLDGNPLAMLGVGADGIGVWQARKIATQGAAAAATPIIEAGLRIMTVMNNLCGFMKPDEGSRYGEGADSFGEIGGDFTGTKPPESWTGDAANAYGAVNDLQKKRAAKIADVDREVQSLIKDQAKQVTDTRDAIDAMQTGLSAFIIPAVQALSIEIPPGAGVAMSTEIQMLGFQLTVPVASGAFSMLAAQGVQNAVKFHTLGQRYAEIGSLDHEQADTGMGELTSESGDMRATSDKQTQMVSAIHSATNHTKHVWGQVAATHGLVCAPSATALGDADMSRSSIGQRTAMTSSNLAEKLSHAASRYDREDQQNAGKLSSEMHPR